MRFFLVPCSVCFWLIVNCCTYSSRIWHCVNSSKWWFFFCYFHYYFRFFNELALFYLLIYIFRFISLESLLFYILFHDFLPTALYFVKPKIWNGKYLVLSLLHNIDFHHAQTSIKLKLCTCVLCICVSNVCWTSSGTNERMIEMESGEKAKDLDKN